MKFGRLNWLSSALLAICLHAGCATAAPKPVSTLPQPPAIQREFRGVWVATVGNIDWPSKPGLPVPEQKAELLAILNRASQLKLNVVVFQVRPGCDALYPSAIEPWSEYLTGTMGRSPGYDPLAFAIEEAHKRGLELHAWFNPYRAHHFNARSPVAASHISKTKPQLVREYGRYLWLDPGEREVQEYSLGVVMDVLKRYDVDGIHFDDYFYPYAEKGGDGRDLDFPDEASWRKYGVSSGLSRNDWRRENVNTFIQRVYNSIKAQKPWVKFGISPFGIWRPGNPPQIRGFDQYDKLYADARKWIINGWADYFAPQLYWGIAPPEQSFPALLGWWAGNNPKHRTLCAGLDVTKSSKWSPEEIPNQISITRNQSNSHGYVLWNMKSTGRNTTLCIRLQNTINARPALAPAMTWIDRTPPLRPSITTASAGAGADVAVSWKLGGAETNRFWFVQSKVGDEWSGRILPISSTTQSFPRANLKAVAVTAIDRSGLASEACVLEFKAERKHSELVPAKMR
ncbi:MAG: family 10 glycosylhydrolase [Verrucomicrobia bacterium]|nr:family 10 glycosylhydrolase [Verrucomicrobiota bacterium]